MNNTAFIEQCARHARTPHHFLSFERLTHQIIFPVPTVILYPENSAQANLVYQDWSRYIRKFALPVPVTHIYDARLYLNGEQGLFKDRVNGHKEHAPDFLRWFAATETLI